MQKKVRGLTLIEVMIVLAIAAVILSLAAPSFANFIRDMRLKTGLGDLSADLLLARSESVRRNSRMLLCPRSTTTSTTCAAVVTAATWMNGWLVCYDRNADGACDASTADDPNPVRVRTAPTAPLSLAGPAATVSFFPMGNANAAATFTLTATGTAATRSLVVAPSGSVISSKT